MKKPSKFVVLSDFPNDVYMTDKRGYTFIADRLGEPENAQQLCQLLNKAFQSERARVRRMVETLKKYYQNEQDKYNAKHAYSAAMGCAHRMMACDDILAKLKEGR